MIWLAIYYKIPNLNVCFGHFGGIGFPDPITTDLVGEFPTGGCWVVFFFSKAMLEEQEKCKQAEAIIEDVSNGFKLMLHS